MIDRKRLAHLLGMMGSNQDGEALNAARLAEKLRQASGQTWDEVIAERIVEKRLDASQEAIDQAVRFHAQAAERRIKEAQQVAWQEGWKACLAETERLNLERQLQAKQTPQPRAKRTRQEMQWRDMPRTGFMAKFWEDGNYSATRAAVLGFLCVLAPVILWLFTTFRY